MRKVKELSEITGSIFLFIIQQRVLQVFVVSYFVSNIALIFESWFFAVIPVILASFYFSYAFFERDHDKSDQYLMFIFFLMCISININVFAEIYESLGVYDHDGNLVEDSNDAKYFSIVTWTTLGYGDFRPSVAARPYAATQALLGYFFMGILVGKVISIFSNTSLPREVTMNMPLLRQLSGELFDDWDLPYDEDDFNLRYTEIVSKVKRYGKIMSWSSRLNLLMNIRPELSQKIGLKRITLVYVAIRDNIEDGWPTHEMQLTANEGYITKGEILYALHHPDIAAPKSNASRIDYEANTLISLDLIDESDTNVFPRYFVKVSHDSVTDILARIK